MPRKNKRESSKILRGSFTKSELKSARKTRQKFKRTHEKSLKINF